MSLSRTIQRMRRRKNRPAVPISAPGAAKAADVQSDVLVLSNGTRMAARLNRTGYDWLQAHYDKPLGEVWDSNVTEEDSILALMALVHQANPDMPPAEARAAVVNTDMPGLMWDLLLQGGVTADLGQPAARQPGIAKRLMRRFRRTEQR